MEDISLHILDIAENSINAGATLVEISLAEDMDRDLFSIRIQDNGKGIPKEILAEVLDPFYTTRTTRKIGLGLALLAQAATETGGTISIDSTEHGGTVVNADFRPRHIDMKPLGNIADTLIVLIAGNPEIDFVFTYSTKNDSYSLDTREIRVGLEDVPINSPSVISVLRDHMKKSLHDMGKEVL